MADAPHVILLAVVSVQVTVVVAVAYLENRMLLHQETKAFIPHVLSHLSERRLSSSLSPAGSPNSGPFLIGEFSFDEEALFENRGSGEKRDCQTRACQSFRFVLNFTYTPSRYRRKLRALGLRLSF